MEMQKKGTKFEHQFTIPLPENLPSSLYYNGDLMSQIAVVYELKANLVGLKRATQHSLPEGEVVYGVTEVVKIRARDPPTKQGITQQATGETKGALGGSNGPCTVSGNLPSDVCYQNQAANVVIHVNNGECKKSVKKTQLKVNRTITATAIDPSGKAHQWNDKQCVMYKEFPTPVAKQEPNLGIFEF